MPEEARSRQSVDTTGDTTPIFVVPLEHERRTLVAAGLPADRVWTCGPGREGIRRWADRHPDLDRPVILVGLAGGLDPQLTTGTVIIASEVMDSHGRSNTPPLANALGLDAERGRVATAGRLVASPEAKLALARATGARIVDQESDHFAEIARIRGWTWGVIRVVGDSAEEAIPTALERFIDHEGRTRFGAVASEIFQRPSLIPVLRRIGRQSRNALTNLATALLAIKIDLDSTETDTSQGNNHHGPSTVLIFGGSFDPPHRGHLLLPFEAARRLGCREIVFVPARVNPLKQATPPSPGEDRVAMLEAALAARVAAGTEPRIPASVSRIEIDRDGPSYMIDTLRELHRTLEGDQIDGEDSGEIRKRPRLRLLIGSDQALAFDRWRDWKAILELAPPAVMPRPPETRTTLAVAYREHFPSNLAGRWSTWTLDLPAEHVSSTVIRGHLARNEPTEELLPPGVQEYIRTRGLYESKESAPGRTFEPGSDRPPAYDADA